MFSEVEKYKNFQDAVKESKIHNSSNCLEDKSLCKLSYDSLEKINSWYDEDLIKGVEFYYVVGYDGSIGIVKDEELGAEWFLTPPEE